ncbi:MBL fold metallo-hydrolase [uncultured Ferrimonas sp.]|uniref:MBL fold metallo-hydrolase n=1 Tax=uncultured Ferrimonas sp. TaxID=432640 RepID=UPI0026399E82|nr:MBL fold metallo-hydrolase [uncultured Ferrimonas sp.]
MASIGIRQQWQWAQQPKFENSEIHYQTPLSDVWKMAKNYFTTKRVDISPAAPLPSKIITSAELSRQQDRLYRLGHSTVLMQLDNRWLITDPVFSDRASPVQWAGPKRFQAAALTLAQLPPLDIVVISHDHYDHLDQTSIEYLADKAGHFVVPSNVGHYLRQWGVPASKITELAWWQSTRIDGIELVATPAQHFSGRGLVRDRSLWASFVINSANHKLFFSGDSGYFNGFKEIGRRYGPFDLTLMETGAYNELWSQIHMLPEQSVQAHLDVGGQVMLPIHNSTFDLALHPWHEPLRRARAAAQQQGVTLLSPQFGQAVPLQQPLLAPQWQP